MADLRSSVHDLSEEVDNLDRQLDATSRLVRALDEQLVEINTEVRNATGQLVRAEDELVIKRAMLRHRLVDIYKRGPLYTTEALLTAESFGALVARYKYLHLLALRDQALVARVELLRNQVGHQRRVLVGLQNDGAGQPRQRRPRSRSGCGHSPTSAKRASRRPSARNRRRPPDWRRSRLAEMPLERGHQLDRGRPTQGRQPAPCPEPRRPRAP